MKKYLLLSVLIITSAVYNCRKSGTASMGPMITVKAKIINTGSIAADGCGYMVEIDSTTHTYVHPTNLDAAYMTDQLRVNITYQQTHSNFSCGNGIAQIDPSVYNAIYINTISKR